MFWNPNLISIKKFSLQHLNPIRTLNLKRLQCHNPKHEQAASFAIGWNSNFACGCGLQIFYLKWYSGKENKNWLDFQDFCRFSKILMDFCEFTWISVDCGLIPFPKSKSNTSDQKDKSNSVGETKTIQDSYTPQSKKFAAALSQGFPNFEFGCFRESLFKSNAEG